MRRTPKLQAVLFDALYDNLDKIVQASETESMSREDIGEAGEAESNRARWWWRVH